MANTDKLNPCATDADEAQFRDMVEHAQAAASALHAEEETDEIPFAVQSLVLGLPPLLAVEDEQRAWTEGLAERSQLEADVERTVHEARNYLQAGMAPPHMPTDPEVTNVHDPSTGITWSRSDGLEAWTEKGLSATFGWHGEDRDRNGSVERDETHTCWQGSGPLVDAITTSPAYSGLLDIYQAGDHVTFSSDELHGGPEACYNEHGDLTPTGTWDFAGNHQAWAHSALDVMPHELYTPDAGRLDLLPDLPSDERYVGFTGSVEEGACASGWPGAGTYQPPPETPPAESDWLIAKVGYDPSSVPATNHTFELPPVDAPPPEPHDWLAGVSIEAPTLWAGPGWDEPPSLEPPLLDHGYEPLHSDLGNMDHNSASWDSGTGGLDAGGVLDTGGGDCGGDAGSCNASGD